MRRKIFLYILLFIICLLILFLIFLWHADRTNPYSPRTEMTPAYVALLSSNNQFILKKQHPVYVKEDLISTLIVKIQTIIRIVGNGWFPSKPISGNDQQIIEELHKERFDPTKAYIISGDHFTDFYPRNYGLFYNAALDPRLQTNYSDWENRQKMILQTTAMYLDILDQSKRTYSAYMPLSNTSMVGVDVWVYPSDSLYSLLFQLSALTNNQFIPSVFPMKIASSSSYPLQTREVALKLIAQHKAMLRRQILSYEAYILDPQTHLVKKNLELSGVRDGIIKRQSSFYDNVIAYSTAKLASDLGILPVSNSVLADWKKRIINAFWDNKAGIFLDDLSDEAKQKEIFPGDGLIIAQTQFLDPKNPQDYAKIVRMIQYVKAHKLDKPFPLPWGLVAQPDRLVFEDRYFVPDYMGPSIFSHWGTEYIKEILLVSGKHPEFIADARKYLENYTENIEKYGGYPEEYFMNGTPYHSLVYKTILHLGWVIDYEQAEMILKHSSS